jgi:hypothetical protein
MADAPYANRSAAAPEAAAKARAEIGLQEGETLVTPRFVHDGPPGREAWLMETRQLQRPLRWIFVTPGGCTARRAGARIGGDPGVE